MGTIKAIFYGQDIIDQRGLIRPMPGRHLNRAGKTASHDRAGSHDIFPGPNFVLQDKDLGRQKPQNGRVVLGTDGKEGTTFASMWGLLGNPGVRSIFQWRRQAARCWKHAGPS